MKKRILAVALILTGMLSLTGCFDSMEDAAKSAQKKISGIGANGNLNDKVQQGVNEAFDQFKDQMEQFGNF